MQTFGLTAFFVGAAAAPQATTTGQIIGCRAVLGLGAAFIMPSTLSILVNVFADGERATAIAISAAQPHASRRAPQVHLALRRQRGQTTPTLSAASTAKTDHPGATSAPRWNNQRRRRRGIGRSRPAPLGQRRTRGDGAHRRCDEMKRRCSEPAYGPRSPDQRQERRRADMHSFE